MRRVAIAAVVVAVFALVPSVASGASVEPSYRQLVAQASGAGGSPIRAPMTGSSVYSDATGDAGPGPDITAVTVENDDARVLTFKIDIPNRPLPTSGFGLVIFLNTDLDFATGDPDPGGIDYVIVGTSDSYGLGRWTGSDMDFSQIRSLKGTYASGPTFTINAADIGNPEVFSFWIGTSDSVDDLNNFDAIPDIGQSIYALEITPVITGLDIPRGALAAHAGKTLSLTAIRLRLDTDELVEPDARDCSAKLAGKALPELSGGCRWKIPKTARGNKLVVVFTLGYKGAETTKTVSTRVRK